MPLPTSKKLICASADCRPIIKIQSKTLYIRALIDSGANATLLRQDIFDQYCQENHRLPLLKPTCSIQGVSGGHLQVLGATEISLPHVPIPIKVTVVRHMPYQMIIGDPQLRSGKAVIDLNSNKLFWFKHKWPLTHITTPVSNNNSTPITTNHNTISDTEIPWSANPQINNIIRENKDVFSGTGQPTGFCKVAKLSIHTHGRPIAQRAYRAPLIKRRLIDDAIDEMLKDDIIEPSNSPWSSPVTLQKKKDGSHRFCIDFRKVNDITTKDTYPLPLIDDIFDLAAGKAVYSTLDFKSGYHQFAIEEKDRPKTAFRCHRGLYQMKRVPFGLSSAPSFFQRTLDKILHDFIGKFCFIYIDDLVIFSDSIEQHLEHLQLIFNRLREVNLKLKPSKCFFGLQEVKLLGFIIGSHGKRTDPEKTQAINNMSPPTTVKGIRSFLGLANYYRSFVPNYADVVEPLVKLTRKHTRFQWDSQQQKAFETLKTLLTSSPIMAPPRPDKPYKLFTDASDNCIGAILVQEGDDGVEHVIQYISHALTPTQRRWPTIEKEAYALIYSLQKLKCYLQGAQVTAYTDHKPLKCLFTKELNNTKLQRWAVLLAEYAVEIKYRQGKYNIRADMLSRIEHPDQINVIDTEDYVVPTEIPDQNFQERLPLIYDNLNLQEVARYQEQEFPELWNIGLDPEEDEYEVIEGNLFSIIPPHNNSPLYPRLVLPSPFRQAIINRAHMEVGHMSTWKTLQRITDAYVWPKMRRDINKQLKTCPTCLLHNRHPQHTPPGMMPTAYYPMQIISMDLIGPMATSTNGNKYALTVIDHCSGWAEVYPLPDKTNQGVWQAISNHFIPTHGVPEIIITDRGMEFNSNDFNQYLSQIGVDHRTTTSFHPNSNGKSERFNRSFKQLLSKLINNNTAAWEAKIPDALLAYRNSVSVTTGFTPFHLLYGRKPRTPFSQLLDPNNHNTFGPRLHNLAQTLQIARQHNQASRQANHDRIMRKANAAHLQAGDTVIIKADPREALTSRWDPHYEVTRVNGPVIHVYQQQTGKTRVVNREKVVLVDPHVIWDHCEPRPRRRRPPPRVILPNPDQQQNIPAPPARHPLVEPRPRSPSLASQEDSESEISDIDMDLPPPDHLPRPASPGPTDPVDQSQPGTSRPRRARRLTARARQAAEQGHIFEDNTDPIARHLRKRLRHTSPDNRPTKQQKCSNPVLLYSPCCMWQESSPYQCWIPLLTNQHYYQTGYW